MPLDDRCVELDCPAKVNLTLAILGRRADGFHELHSVVAQTRFGDRLRLEWDPEGVSGEDRVITMAGKLPAGDNTISHALRLFREAGNFRDGTLTARLWKRIPVGAGLGGGSSDAVATLKALRSLFGAFAPHVDWNLLATTIGSDCRLFMEQGPVLMKGRGEVIEPLPAGLAARFRGRSVILFKPAFSIGTAEAYRRLAAGSYYSTETCATSLLRDWESSDLTLPPAHNDFQRLVEDWMPSLGVVLERLANRHGLDARLSGSGSACFLFPSDGASVIDVLTKELDEAWGRHYWLMETEFN